MSDRPWWQRFGGPEDAALIAVRQKGPITLDELDKEVFGRVSVAKQEADKTAIREGRPPSSTIADVVETLLAVGLVERYEADHSKYALTEKGVAALNKAS